MRSYVCLYGPYVEREDPEREVLEKRPLLHPLKTEASNI